MKIYKQGKTIKIEFEFDATLNNPTKVRVVIYNDKNFLKTYTTESPTPTGQNVLTTVTANKKYRLTIDAATTKTMLGLYKIEMRIDYANETNITINEGQFLVNPSVIGNLT